ncbi:enoyl-CoA hydratase/isomerase family protein [Parahaliea mediterranea]|uniref:Enoyl-CoA hydratase/isomerase family protein n=1 Tax=Parahaliea mediterranea TaxID=651086 RepID=A0A939IKM8_9GAMM|nr:enoyl-CoA hydratase/isomerase family protein [Parahaliea mediterranea]MBN7795122.1 enoyl-CoA hydratase/isomerase family protein [Parahaliea mediterranea]
MTDTIKYSSDGRIGRLLLNNPGRHNSLGEEQLSAMQQHLRMLTRTSGPRVLVITGAGDRTFCSGASLQEMNSGKISGELFQDTTDLIAALPIPTIAALNGNVFGGGVELALSCDFRIGLEGTRMRVPAAAIGLCYPTSGIERFVQRLGVSAAKRLLMAAEEISGRDMVDIGFLDYLSDREGFQAAVENIANNLSDLAPLAVCAMKEIIQGASAGALDPERVRVLAQRCLESEDLQEGFAAQREKRKPDFSGR